MDKNTSDKNTTLLKHQDIYDLRKRIESLDAPCFDSEVYSKGLEIAVFYIKNGYVKFLDFSHKLLKDIGNCIKPYLKSLYSGIRYCPGMDSFSEEMSSLDFVDKIDIKAIKMDNKYYLDSWRFAFGVWHATEFIEKGYYLFEDYAKLMLKDFGHSIHHEIVTCYNFAHAWYESHGIHKAMEGMNSKDYVDYFNLDALIDSIECGNRFYAPKEPCFLTITKHPGVLEGDDILMNLILFRKLSEQKDKFGDIDAREALKWLYNLSDNDYMAWVDDSYFYDPDWKKCVWERYNINPENGQTRDRKPIQLYPIEEVFAEQFSDDGRVPTREEAENLMIEMLKDSFLQKFWEPTPEWDHTGPERIDDDKAEDQLETKKSANYLRNKYKSFEEGLAAYLEWEESYLEPYEKPATEKDKEIWTDSFKRLWEKEELKGRRD